MSKELEALKRVVNEISNYKLHSIGDENWLGIQDILKDIDIIEQALNELEDAKNNYNALKEFYNNAVAYGARIQKELNELKKRNEPMKVINGTTVNGVCLDYECPSCKQEIDNSGYSKDQYYLIKHCIFCGQRIDWSE